MEANAQRDRNTVPFYPPVKYALEQNKLKLTLSAEINGEDVIDICSLVF